MLEASGEDLPSRGSLGVGCWAYPLPLASLWNVGFWWLDCFDDGWLNSEIRISTLNETHLTSYHVLQTTRVSEFFQFLWCFVRIHGRFFYCIGCCTLIGIIIIENQKNDQPVQLDHSEKLARTSHILRPSSWILTLQLWRCYTITVTISSLNLLGAPSQFVWKPLVGSKWSLDSTAPLQYRMYRCCGPHYVMVITWVITYDSRVNINQEFLSISMICQCSSVSTVSGSRSTESSLVGGCGKGANEKWKSSRSQCSP